MQDNPFGDKRYRPIPGFSTLDQTKQLALRHFNTRGADSFQQKKYLYEVQIVTRDRRTNDLLFRTINVTEKERSNLGSILGAARDVIMDSPVSSREDFVRAELVDAFYHAKAPNVD